MLTVAIAIGVVVSLAFTELTGLVAGGIVVPGYVALLLDRPGALAAVAGVTAATWATVALVERWALLYGARRFAVTLLVGLAYASATTWAVGAGLVPYVPWAGIGYVVPGLVAHQLARQGPLRTLLAIAITAPLVRVLLEVVLRLGAAATP